MDERKDSNAEVKEQFDLAKLLLLKYGALHSFHEQQLKAYVVACCDISLQGKIEICPEDKKVIFDLITSRNYYLKGKEVEKIKWWQIFKALVVSKRQYEQQKEIAYKNLKEWTSHLLWDEATKVEVFVDGIKFRPR